MPFLSKKYTQNQFKSKINETQNSNNSNEKDFNQSVSKLSIKNKEQAESFY